MTLQRFQPSPSYTRRNGIAVIQSCPAFVADSWFLARAAAAVLYGIEPEALLCSYGDNLTPVPQTAQPGWTATSIRGVWLEGATPAGAPGMAWWQRCVRCDDTANCTPGCSGAERA